MNRNTGRTFFPASFSKYNVVKVTHVINHGLWQFLLLCDCLIIRICQYPFYCRWAFELLPVGGFADTIVQSPTQGSYCTHVWVSLRYTPRSGNARCISNIQYVSSIFGNDVNVNNFQGIHIICTPSNNLWEYPCSTFSPTFGVFLIYAVLVSVE